VTTCPCVAGETGDIWTWLGGADNVTATLIALLALGGIVRVIWRRTVRRRSMLRSALNNLAIGTNEEYVRSLFDAPAYGQVDAGNGHLAWVTPYANIAVQLQKGRVGGFVITVTDTTFRFDPAVVSLGYVRGRLGHTTFKAAAGPPDGQFYNVGARRYSYSENYFHGNPGGYLQFCLACSDSSEVGNRVVPPEAAGGYLSSGDRRSQAEGDVPAEELEALARLHRDGLPNTVGVCLFDPAFEGLADSGAIDGDIYRLFPTPEGHWLRLERLIATVADLRLRRRPWRPRQPTSP
jgi:hypothetical protein